ncbi:Alpha/beta hydrolase of unknown function [Lutimaribacter pacificus]|uniref:Alpha/beta hydrolase family protein n=2 Tax=Lutimaribacter pacificus TaxID=391948 RepID=A0A1H0BCY2_9RHOB|nr:Alpha/beta hydrolase of unknown function [Lutimaribacter pacificus]SHJ57512.1 Alpha/beta hydrolase of unknown function [Lutimaribacter pacificus]
MPVHNILWVAGMTLLRINAQVSGQDDLPDLGPLAGGRGPVLIMTHGYKFQPGHPQHCPHRHILSEDEVACRKAVSWPRLLGAGQDGTAAVAFGWPARGTIWQAWAQAGIAGVALARVIAAIRETAPHRPVHAIAHSLGARVVLSALRHLPEGALSRAILLTGAEFAASAAAALDTRAGRRVELINVTSRENDLFDFLLERLVTPPVPGDRVIGHGLPGQANTLTLQIDDPRTLAVLAGRGYAIAPPRARICHWSAYLRPGVFDLYRAFLSEPDTLPLAHLQRLLPKAPQPRWSRLLDPPRVTLPLPFARNASS